MLEVVPLNEYAGEIPADRIEPLRRHSYPGLIVKIEGTEEEVVITSYLLFLKADEPEEDGKQHCSPISNPTRTGRNQAQVRQPPGNYRCCKTLREVTTSLIYFQRMILKGDHLST